MKKSVKLVQLIFRLQHIFLRSRAKIRLSPVFLQLFPCFMLLQTWFWLRKTIFTFFETIIRKRPDFIMNNL